jgi:HK97 gp10 family phage protein
MPRKYRLDKLEMPELEAMEPIARKYVMREGLKVIVLYLRANVPDSGTKHKGKLNKSIRYNVKAGGLIGTVRAVAPHAHLVHEGVPHRRGVEPNKRRQPPVKALLIPGIGFRASASAGPMPANPFLLRAAEETRDEMDGVMRHAMTEAATMVAAGATK